MVSALNECLKSWTGYDVLSPREESKNNVLSDKVKTTLAGLGHPFPEKILLLEKKFTVLLSISPNVAMNAGIAGISLLGMATIAVVVSLVSFWTFQWYITPWSIGIGCLAAFLGKPSIEYYSEYMKALPSKKEIEELTDFHTSKESISVWNVEINAIKAKLTPDQQTDIKEAQTFFNLKMQNFERLAGLLEAKVEALSQ